MREVLDDVGRWLSEGERVALATVVGTWGSAPRGVGAKMAVSSSGELSGSVSGGCVEGAVIDASLQVLESGVPQLLEFGVTDDVAWDVGLACGGSIEVFVEELDSGFFRRMEERVLEDSPVAVLVDISGEHIDHTLWDAHGKMIAGGSAPDVQVDRAEIQRAIESGESRRMKAQREEGSEIDLFIDVLRPPDTLIMVGGVHISVALAQLAKAVGFKTIIIEPRKAFSDEGRFPFVDEIIRAWPEEAFEQIDLSPRTAVAVLTHDPKIDDQAMRIALPSDAFYVGGLGSQKTQALRRERLRENGISPEDLSRMHGPIGLDIGARTPEEIALSILAEIVEVRRHQHMD